MKSQRGLTVGTEKYDRTRERADGNIDRTRNGNDRAKEGSDTRYRSEERGRQQSRPPYNNGGYDQERRSASRNHEPGSGAVNRYSDADREQYRQGARDRNTSRDKRWKTTTEMDKETGMVDTTGMEDIMKETQVIGGTEHRVMIIGIATHRIR